MSEQLLIAFKTPWKPAVTEYFVSLLSSRDDAVDVDRRLVEDEDGEEGNKLWKSDLYVLINQIHSDLVGKRV